MLFFLPTDTCFGFGCFLYDSENYEKIYEIKGRDFKKLLSVMILDFDWLLKNTDLGEEQIEFLKNYKYPFTILANCQNLKLLFGLQNEKDEFEYSNGDKYEKIAFRVAHLEIQKKVISENGPIFLTSANKSGKEEFYNSELLKKEFEKEIKKYSIKTNFLDGFENLEKNKPSDVFEFDENGKVKYLRKNY